MAIFPLTVEMSINASEDFPRDMAILPFTELNVNVPSRISDEIESFSFPLTVSMVQLSIEVPSTSMFPFTAEAVKLPAWIPEAAKFPLVADNAMCVALIGPNTFWFPFCVLMVTSDALEEAGRYILAVAEYAKSTVGVCMSTAKDEPEVTLEMKTFLELSFAQPETVSSIKTPAVDPCLTLMFELFACIVIEYPSPGGLMVEFVE